MAKSGPESAGMRREPPLIVAMGALRGAILRYSVVSLVALLPMASPCATRESDFATRLIQDVETIEQFDAVASEAKAGGFSNQGILEAKLIFCLKANAFEPLRTLLPEIDTALSTWGEADSPFFKERSQLLGLIHMAKAVLAERDSDENSFEREMKDAFWMDPKLASVLAERISKFRDNRMMQKVVLPMDLVLETTQGEKTTLRELIKSKKALLLDFWASWCSPCMALMDDLGKLATDLEPKKIRVVAVNTESDPAKAEKVRKAKKMSIPWLIEPKEEPFTTLLRIDSIPHVVLVTPDGRIAFSGHPMDSDLNTALKSVVTPTGEDRKPAQ